MGIIRLIFRGSDSASKAHAIEEAARHYGFDGDSRIFPAKDSDVVEFHTENKKQIKFLQWIAGLMRASSVEKDN